MTTTSLQKFSSSFLLAATIHFPPSVDVHSMFSVSLADVVEIKAGQESLLVNFASVPLLAKTEPGKKYEIAGADISALIREQLREAVKGYQLSIPSQMVVQIAAQTLVKSEIERKILNQLNFRCQDCDFTLASLNLPTVSSTEYEIDFQKLVLKGAFMLPLIEKNTTANHMHWVTGQIRTHKPILIFARAMNAGERVQAADLKTAMVDVTFVKDMNLQSDDILGQQLLRSLSAGTVVATSDLKRDPMVKRGQMIKALSGTEEFEVSINAVAEDSGFYGDSVKIKNLDSNKILLGVITAPGQVKIQ